jgi:hypothetical protein
MVDWGVAARLAIAPETRVVAAKLFTILGNPDVQVLKKARDFISAGFM